MLLWIIQVTIISILLVFLVHYLFNFFTSTLTVPRIKDLVNVPTIKYENMYNIIQNDAINGDIINGEGLLPKSNPSQMKDELKSFLKKQLNVSSSTDISTLDSIDAFSAYN
jgi:hypothetical protein